MWDILGSNWTISSWRWRVGSRKKWARVRTWVTLTRAKLRHARFWGVGWGIPVMQRSVCGKKWPKEGQLGNQQHGHGHPRLTGVRGEWRVGHLVWSHIRATVAQLVREGSAEWPCWPLSTAYCNYTGHMSIRTGPWNNRRTEESHFLLHHVDGHVHVVRLPTEEMVPGCTM